MNQDKIVRPEVARSAVVWCDAYTMHLTVLAEASTDPELRRTLRDAVRRTSSEAKRTRSEVDIKAAANQQAVADAIFKFSPEQQKELMAIWKEVRTQFISLSWDMRTEIHFEVDRDKKVAWIWQGEAGALRSLDAVAFTLSHGGMLRRFLKFVAENQDRIDPVTYTKQALLKQGVNKGNFQELVGNAGITNPWET